MRAAEYGILSVGSSSISWINGMAIDDKIKTVRGAAVASCPELSTDCTCFDISLVFQRSKAHIFSGRVRGPAYVALVPIGKKRCSPSTRVPFELLFRARAIADMPFWKAVLFCA